MAAVSRHTLVMCGLIVTCFSCVFQMLGFTCPGWLMVTIDLGLVGIISGGAVSGFGEIVSKSAVWFYHVCVLGDGKSLRRALPVGNMTRGKWGFRLGHVFSRIQDVDWLEVEIELTLALVFCLVALMLVACTYSGLVELGLKTSTSLASGSIIISGILTLIPVIKFSRDISNVKDDVASIVDVTGRQLVTVGFPWALMLSAVGLLLAFISGAIFLIAAFRPYEDSIMISPQAFLAPAILSLGTFPAHISVQDRLGHLPPSELKPRTDSFLIPPSIGGHDDAPFSFQNGRLLRQETTFDFSPPSFAFIAAENSPTGSSIEINSRPPSRGRLSCSSDVITATNIPVITVDQHSESTSITDAESKPKAPEITTPETEQNKNEDAGKIKGTDGSVTITNNMIGTTDKNKHTATGVIQAFKSSSKPSSFAFRDEPNIRKKTTKQTAVHPVENVPKGNKRLDEENEKHVTAKGSMDIKEEPMKRSAITSSTDKQAKLRNAPQTLTKTSFKDTVSVQKYVMVKVVGQAVIDNKKTLQKAVKPEIKLDTNQLNTDSADKQSTVSRVQVVTLTSCGCAQGKTNVQEISKL